MIEIYTLLSIFILGFILGLLFLYVKYKALTYRENKKFWNDVDIMQKRHNKRYDDVIKKALEDSLPLIVEILKKQKASGKLP